MSGSHGIDRRSFFKLLGGGIVVLFGAGPEAARSQDGRRIYPEDFNAYLAIGEDGRVTVLSGKVELGQGAMTAQAQMVAEELGVDLSAIEMVVGDTDRCPWDMGTFGSLTVRMFGPALRAAAAQARLVLTALAAERLGVAPEQLRVEAGRVMVAGDAAARSVGYGELSRGARIVRTVDAKAVLRAAKDFRIMGRSPERLDARDKVTGAAKYAADIRLPGMLYARVLRPPIHGATLRRLDSAAAERMAGAVVVRRDDLVAVLHVDPEAAEHALAHLVADWRLPDAAAKPVDADTIFDRLLARSGAPKALLERGDVASARAAATRIFETQYRKGYVAHAPIEPHAALAQVADGRATVWASTQTPFPLRDQLARTLGLPPARVRVLTPYVGGGFGGKSANGQAIEAARLAQIVGRPVQVAWSRAEEFFFDTFDPAAVASVASGIDASGRIAFWDYAVHGAGDRGATACYDLANVRIRSAGRSPYDPAAPGASVHPFATGAWRAPGANMNVFAIESQIDTMAAAAGIDPVEFRLRHLADPRMRRVLQTAVSAFGWTPAPAPSGRGVGVACSIDAGTYVATMAEVKVDRATSRVAVQRIVCAQDMGLVVNPEGAKMQVEGGLAMGLGYTLSEELRFKGGEILDRNFDDYAIPGFRDVPRIVAVLVSNDELAPQGGGEPSITTTGAVIANALFDASGARLARLPLTPVRVRQAIASAKGG